jgi:hypothetical protein
MPTNLRMDDYLKAANQLIHELAELRWTIGPICDFGDAESELVMQQLVDALKRIFKRDFAGWSDDERHDLIVLAYSVANEQSECWMSGAHEIHWIFALEYGAIAGALAIFGKLDPWGDRSGPSKPSNFDNCTLSVVDGQFVGKCDSGLVRSMAVDHLLPSPNGLLIGTKYRETRDEKNRGCRRQVYRSRR